MKAYRVNLCVRVRRRGFFHSGKEAADFLVDFTNREFGSPNHETIAVEKKFRYFWTHCAWVVFMILTAIIGINIMHGGLHLFTGVCGCLSALGLIITIIQRRHFEPDYVIWFHYQIRKEDVAAAHDYARERTAAMRKLWLEKKNDLHNVRVACLGYYID